MTTETLSDLLVKKQFMSTTETKCFEQEHSAQVLGKCKSATYEIFKRRKLHAQILLTRQSTYCCATLD